MLEVGGLSEDDVRVIQAPNRDGSFFVRSKKAALFGFLCPFSLSEMGWRVFDGWGGGERMRGFL